MIKVIGQNKTKIQIFPNFITDLIAACYYFQTPKIVNILEGFANYDFVADAVSVCYMHACYNSYPSVWPRQVIRTFTLQEQNKVLLIISSLRIFPVHVQTVKITVPEEGDGAVDEGLTRVSRRGHDLELLRAKRPSTCSIEIIGAASHHCAIQLSANTK
jgi:hypothetical protein